MSVQELITEHLDLWTSATTYAANGRGTNGKVDLTGIQKLRKFILELAVRGKLVEQDPGDEPSRELIRGISEDTAISSGNKHPDQLESSEIAANEIPYHVPKTWEWARIGDLFHVVYGKGLPKSELTEEGYDVFGANGIIGKYIEYTYEEPQLLISCRGAYSGKANLSPAYCFITSNTLVLQNSWMHLNKHYFYYALTAAEKSKIVTGSAQPQVTSTNLKPLLVAVPPINEQHRIVQKVDELMALCDRLEQQASDQLEAHETLVDTLLETLTQSENATELADNWARLAAHFDTLFTTEQSIDKLKQSILQLAVMGRLVEQDEADEPALKLKERLHKEKLRLADKGFIKRPKTQASIADEEILYSLPTNWAWALWDELCMKIGDIDHKMPPTTEAGFPYVSPRDFLPKNGINFEGAKKISEVDFVRLASKIQPCKGDIIFPRYGTIGDNRLVESEIDFLASYSCAVIKPLSGLISSRYFYFLSLSELTKTQSKAAENKTTQANVGIGSIKKFLFALPPLAEQHRIVQKVDELMALCEQLKERLNQTSKTRCQLAEAVVEGALN